MPFDTSSAISWAKEILATGGTSAVVTYGLLKWYGDKWLEQRFKVHLEEKKHEQQKELEDLRRQIQSMFSRISKIHEKEFEVLPKAWLLLHTAYGYAFNMVGRMVYDPNFEGMEEALFEEFLRESELSDYQKGKLRAAPNRRTYYIEARESLELDKANRACQAFNNFLVEHRIFMNEELRRGFGSFSSELVAGLHIYADARRTKNHSLFSEGTRKILDLQKQVDEIEKAVQNRLRYEDA